MLKNQRGITLVALVVTIIVLIILATISISVALNGGIIDRADKGSAMYQAQEANFLAADQETAALIDAYEANALAASEPADANNVD